VSLTIRRFSLRLERRGGTGWGSELEQIMAAAQSSLPSQIAEALADKLDTNEDAEISEPVRLQVRMSLAELAEACRSESGMQRLAARLVAGVTIAAQPAGTEARTTAPTTARIATPGRIGRPDANLSIAAAGATDIRAVVLDWHRSNAIDQMLARLPEAALRTWFVALREHAPRSQRGAEPVDASELRAAIAALVARLTGNGARLASVAVPTNVEASASAAAAIDSNPHKEHARDAATVTTPARRTSDSRAGGQRSPAAAHPSATTTLEGLALPFLLLRPLSGSGYLDVAAASFSAVDRTGDLVRFATALAFQVLDAPARGWNYDAKAVATAAGFSGHPTLLNGALDGTAALCGPLDATLAQSQLRARDGRQPLLLRIDAHGALLVDRTGLLPIAWQATLDDLLAIAAPIQSLVIVPAASAQPTTLDALAFAGARFVTDAPPARHEHWHRVAGVRAWTNDRDAADRELAALMQSFALDEDVGELVATLVARQLRGIGPIVARSVGLAAAVALGDLADRLWRVREPTSPPLALSRFADLSARITLAPSGIDVAIPRGARFRDLERAGFLGTFAPPWLDGRSLTIGPA